MHVWSERGLTLTMIEHVCSKSCHFWITNHPSAPWRATSSQEAHLPLAYCPMVCLELAVTIIMHAFIMSDDEESCRKTLNILQQTHCPGARHLPRAGQAIFSSRSRAPCSWKIRKTIYIIPFPPWLWEKMTSLWFTHQSRNWIHEPDPVHAHWTRQSILGAWSRIHETPAFGKRDTSEGFLKWFF